MARWRIGAPPPHGAWVDNGGKPIYFHKLVRTIGMGD
jgi:hypothetical protein